MACGALTDEDRWIEPRRGPHFLFPVHALSRVLRGKFLQALGDAEQGGVLPRDPAATPQQRRQRRQALREHGWVVYAKTPLAGPVAVLDYLARYTNRTAIGNERLLGIDNDRVLLRVRSQRGDGRRTVALDARRFIGRLLQHVLPGGFKRIRHYGLLAPAAKTRRLAAARSALAMPAPNPRAREDALAFMRRVAAIDIGGCPHCGVGRWRVVEELAADKAVLAAIASTLCRGPP
jgi:hypothetical protein